MCVCVCVWTWWIVSVPSRRPASPRERPGVICTICHPELTSFIKCIYSFRSNQLSSLSTFVREQQNNNNSQRLGHSISVLWGLIKTASSKQQAASSKQGTNEFHTNCSFVVSLLTANLWVTLGSDCWFRITELFMSVHKWIFLYRRCAQVNGTNYDILCDGLDAQCLVFVLLNNTPFVT